MGVYKAAVVTEGGQSLIAQAFTSEKKLIFTSAKTSSHSYPAGTNVSALTGLQDVVQSVIPSGAKTIDGNVAQVTVRFDNDSIDQAYLIQTIGLYAKIEDGEETLFSVTQATVPDEMPVHSDVSPSAYIYNIQSTVQNASQITITVNPTGAASVQDFLDIQNPAFDDSGTSEEISNFPEFLDTVKSKMNFFQFFRNLKAGLQFVLHAGSIVNNCVTDNPNLPLSAAQGKALQDALTVLNNELKEISSNLTVTNIDGSSHKKITKTFPYATYTDIFQCIPNTDGMIYLNVEINLNAVSAVHGSIMLQVYSSGSSQSYVNDIQTLNPYTNGRGSLSLHLEKTFYAKAGVTYKIRCFQATMDDAAHDLPVDLYSNIIWTTI